MLTHRNMVANMLQVVALHAGLGEVEDPAVITALPLYHIFALTTNCWSSRMSAATTC